MGSYYVSEEIIDLKIANAIAANPGGSSYLVYTALLTQVGTAAPTVHILQNTIGDIDWQYDIAGRYYGVLTGAFTENKTWVNACQPFSNQQVEIAWYDADNIQVITTEFQSPNWPKANNILNLTSIEIRVYP